jgi:amylosucrase
VDLLTGNPVRIEGGVSLRPQEFRWLRVTSGG